MRIFLLGASGGTGRCVVEQGLRQGHEITAYVRNPAALSVKSNNLHVVKGDINNGAALSAAMGGHDAVISVLGNKTRHALWKPARSISQALPAIISSMKGQGVRRLVFVTSFGINHNMFWLEKIIARTILKNLFADLPAQEKLVKSSGLDWTLVRPARLVIGLKTGSYRIGENL